MRRYLLLCLALFISVFIHAQATDLVVDCQTPGWLSSKINYGDQQTVENLKVTGYINTTDLQFIGSLTQMSLTGIIDLADAIIVGGEWNGAFKSLPNSWSKDYEYHLQKLVLPRSLTFYLEHRGAQETEIDTLVFDTQINKIAINRLYEYEGSIDPTLKRKIGHLIIGENVDSIETVGSAKTVSFPSSLRYIGNYACQERTDLSKWNIKEFLNLEYLGYCSFTYSGPGHMYPESTNNRETLPDSIFFRK